MKWVKGVLERRRLGFFKLDPRVCLLIDIPRNILLSRIYLTFDPPCCVRSIRLVTDRMETLYNYESWEGEHIELSCHIIPPSQGFCLDTSKFNYIRLEIESFNSSFVYISYLMVRRTK